MRVPTLPADLWSTPAWGRAKKTADRVLVTAVAAALGWTAIGIGFSVRRATTNRAIATVHLAGRAVGFSTLSGKRVRPLAHPGARLAPYSEILAISVTNDSPDGVVISGPILLEGPYLVGTTRLKADGTGYIVPAGMIQLRGEVTVDCAAAAPVTAAMLRSTLVPGLAPTEVSFTAEDADGRPHPTTLVIDTTAYAVQGQVCTS